jgi:putative ABC transport system ATP-binding protein
MSLTTTTTTRTAARAQQLTKVFGRGETAVRALDQVDVEFGSGTFTAIMGPSGSGKSTLMHCLAGLDLPTSGTITIGDTEITGLNDKALTRIRRDRVGFVFQSFNLLPTLTARANILLPLDLAGRTADRDRFAGLVDSLGLTDRLDHRPSELSGGQQQRVAIARALITQPDVVFADEPTGALDSRTAADLLGYLRRSCTELGQTIVMVTHDPIAASYADRALLLSDGRITDAIEDPTTDTVLAAMKRLEA